MNPKVWDRVWFMPDDGDPAAEGKYHEASIVGVISETVIDVCAINSLGNAYLRDRVPLYEKGGPATGPYATYEKALPVPPPTEVSLTVYEHDNFVGVKFVTDHAVPNFAAPNVNFNDRASSAIVTGRWEVFADSNFQGRKVVLEAGNHPSLRQFSFNDQMSSARPLVPPVVVPPGPAPKKYIVSFGGSPDGVVPYVNLRFLPCWGTTETAMKIDEIKRSVALGIREVAFNVDQEMWGDKESRPVRYKGSTQAMANMRALCDALKAAGALGYIKIWWMIDEPGRDYQISESDFRQCAMDIRAVSAEYPDLAGVKLAAIYGDQNDPKLAADLMDYIGMDNYGIGAGILPFYDELEASLQAHQSSMLVPGMYSLEGKPMVIEDFVPHMENNPRCNMLCVFIYDQAQQGYSVNGQGPRVMAVADQIKAMNA